MGTPAGYRRIIAYGETGAGKTRLLQAEADRYARAGGEVWTLDVKKKLPRPLRGRRIRLGEAADWGQDAFAYDWANAWCSHAMAVAVKRGYGLMIVLDEVDTVIKNGVGIPPGLRSVVMQGREFGVSYGLGVRVPPEIPTRVRSQAEDLYLFRQTEPRYVQWMRERGVPDSPAIDTLPTGCYWHLKAGQKPHFHAHLFVPCE